MSNRISLTNRHLAPSFIVVCLVVIAFLLPNSAFADSDDDARAIVEFFNENKIGDDAYGGPQALEKETSYGWVKVAIVFGYIDDFAVCEEWKVFLTDRYSPTRYRCTPVLE